MLLTAFGENPDGKGTILRVWDQTGQEGTLTVTLPGKFTTATPINLRGECPGKPIPIQGGILTFQLGKYAPASFLLN